MSDCGLKTPISALRNPQSAVPLLLYPAPQALEVVCVAPDGPPQFVWLENRRERIVHLRGRSGSKRCGGAGLRCGAITTASPLESGSHLWIFRRLSGRALVPARCVRVTRQRFTTEDTESTEKRMLSLVIEMAIAEMANDEFKFCNDKSSLILLRVLRVLCGE